MQYSSWLSHIEELDGPAVSALRSATAKVKQRWSVIGRSTKYLLLQAPPCFGRHVKPLVLAAFAVVRTHQSALALVVGYGPFTLCVIHKEGLFLTQGKAFYVAHRTVHR
jgi:hypothetical protein